jgi:hypothetical protein
MLIYRPEAVEMVSFLRIYADEAGESHFADLDVAFEEERTLCLRRRRC